VSLNIKNERAHRLAEELAALTGESLTAAVLGALELRLRLETERRNPIRKAERMLAFARRFSAGMPSTLRSTDHGDILYGDDGLPR
jgi:antitoxin VapB